MFQNWIKSIQLSTDDSAPDKSSLERLTALLLIEIARSDTSIDDTELTAIRTALASSSNSIDDHEIDEIIDTAIKDANTSTSLHTQLRQINTEFSHRKKTQLVEQMWVVALADENLDKYEEHMIRQLANLLYLSHADYIQAKLKVIESAK